MTPNEKSRWIDPNKPEINNPNYNYQSPITIVDSVVQSFNEQLDNEVLKACHEVAIFVDKDELTRALQYDRDQYNKGFRDGYNVLPKRRIDTMTEEELAKIIAAIDGSVFGSMCEGCVLDDKDCECSDGNECGKEIAHYLLSPAEEEINDPK